MSQLGDSTETGAVTSTSFSFNPNSTAFPNHWQLRRGVDKVSLSRDLSRSFARQSKKQLWERSLQASARWRGWGLSDHYGKVRLKLQFPADAGIANASATLPYPWAKSSIRPVRGLLTRIYGPVIEGDVTLRTAIADILAISDHKKPRGG